MGIPSRGYLCVGRSAGEAAREHSGFSVNDTIAHCVENQLRRIVQVELFEDVAAMGFHGVGADIQLGSNLLVAFAFGQQLEDFALASGEEFTG
jgi:hypothetical protein